MWGHAARLLVHQRALRGRPQCLSARPRPPCPFVPLPLPAPLLRPVARPFTTSATPLRQPPQGVPSAHAGPAPTAPSGTAGQATGEDAVTAGSIVKTVARHLWPPDEPALRMRVVASVGFLFLAKLFNITVPFLYKAIVDGLVGGAGAPCIFGLSCTAVVVLYGAARLGASGSAELRNTIFIQVTQTALRKIATQVYAHIHSLDLNFHLNRRTGALTNVIERGTKGIGTLLAAVLFNLFPTFLELGLVCGVLWSTVGGEFAAIALITVAVYMLFTTQITVWRTEFRRQMNRMERRATQHAVDGLLNYETVKYFGNERHEVDKYNQYMLQYSKSAIRVQESLSLLNFGQQLIFGTALAYMTYLAAMGVVAGALTVGDVVMINSLLFQLSVPLNFLGGVYRELTQALTDMENMFGVLNQRPLVTDADDAVEYVYAGGRVEFQDVVFHYTPQKPLLQGLTFTIEPGSTVAFVGPSGCGKSTVLRLLYRFYDVQSGCVLLDGQDVRRLQVATMRRYMGVVPQDTVLFNDTIRYNIQYGNLDATEEEVLQAAEKAALASAVAQMPKKLDTLVGERGLKLSGGEKQRVALARVFLKKPRLLMCDEATSALDSTTEASIMQSLNLIRNEDTTTLVIAHRLSTVKNADKIIVLDQGRAVEQGTHVQLLARRGLYYQLWDAQQRHQDTATTPPAPPGATPLEVSEEPAASSA